MSKRRAPGILGIGSVVPYANVLFHDGGLASVTLIFPSSDFLLLEEIFIGLWQTHRTENIASSKIEWAPSSRTYT